MILDQILVKIVIFHVLFVMDQHQMNVVIVMMDFILIQIVVYLVMKHVVLVQDLITETV